MAMGDRPDRRCPRPPVGPGPHRHVPVPHGSPRSEDGRHLADGPATSTRRPTSRKPRTGTCRSSSHVAAGTDFVAETRERQEEADATGHPDAIIGGVSLRVPVAEAVEQLDTADGRVPLPWGSPDGWQHGRGAEPRGPRSAAGAGLVLEMLARPDQIEGWAAALDGWSRADGRRRARRVAPLGLGRGIPTCGGPGYRRWRRSGLPVHCKLSGLSTGFGTIGRGRLQAVDRALPRGIRGRSMLLRKQLPPRRGERQLRRSLLDLCRVDRWSRRGEPREALRLQRGAAVPLLRAARLRYRPSIGRADHGDRISPRRSRVRRRPCSRAMWSFRRSSP